MVVALGVMVLNVAGNWLFIDGRLGFPALGVVGAAWASLGASAVSFLGFFAWFLWDGRGAGAVLPRLLLDEWLRTLRFGLPVGFNWFFEFFAFLFFVNVVVSGLGTTAHAALMAVIQLNSVAFMPAFALASAGAIVVGQAIGAGALQDVPRAVRRTFLLSGGWQFLIGALFVFIPEVLFAPFARAEDADALLQIGARMLALSAAWMLFDAAATTLAEALRAAGDTAFTLWGRVALAWGVLAPGSWLTVHRFGGTEVHAMLWLAGYLGLLAALLYWRFRRGAWRRFDLVGPVPAA
jgi:MATE family multidrug resistance protein